jgi:pimeloyl-ACP methyl ester carboxylesterase
MLQPLCHRRLGLLGLIVVLAFSNRVSGVQAGDAPDVMQLLVLFRGQSIGGEVVTTTNTPAGWLISENGAVDPPFQIVTTKFTLSYSSDWQPKQLTLEGTRAGQLITMTTTFNGSTASSNIMQGGQPASVSHAVPPQAIVLPNGIYAPYVALAARLANATVGTKLPIYVAPQAAITASVDRIIPRRLTSSTGPIELRQYDLTFSNPSGPLAVEVWLDARNRLVRVAIPAAQLVVVREDMSSVMTREESMSRPGDEDVFIPAYGFNLAGTVSKPQGQQGRLPAVVLIGGSGPQTRDEKVFGIPIFGQLSAAIADAGFFVVRYDKRGVGGSGGRVESATLSDYSDDALSVVQWLRARRDVDPERIALVGHSEGAVVALISGSRDKKISALGLIAGPGQTGRELTLLQQAHALARLNDSDATKRAKVDLEIRIIDAVTKDGSWEGIPEPLRRQSDNPWFKSWLLFDPAAIMPKVQQPILIVQGTLDTQVPPNQADLLETLSRQRKKLPPTATTKVVIPGINHLLVPATTGEVDEYATLAGANISPAVTSAVTQWLATALPPKKK